jgi:hypothetical protein
MHSFISSVQWSCCCCVALALVLLRLSMRLLLLLATAALLLLLTWLDPLSPATVHVDACALLCTFQQLVLLPQLGLMVGSRRGG